MSNFITFSTATASVPMKDGGTLNGYKLNSVLHSGRKISLSLNTYYYIPFTNQVVTWKGSKAKPLTRTKDGKYSFIEKYADRQGQWPFKVDSAMVHEACWNAFR